MTGPRRHYYRPSVSHCEVLTARPKALKGEVRSMKLPQTGGCQCGALRYKISEAPELVYTCHCTECQRLTGSAFSMALVVAGGAFHLDGTPPSRSSAQPTVGAGSRDGFARLAGHGSVMARSRTPLYEMRPAC